MFQLNLFFLSYRLKMGLEMFSLHNKVLTGMEGRMKESNMRILIGLGVALVYLLVGAIVFVRYAFLNFRF